jgi:hypothetical protein
LLVLGAEGRKREPKGSSEEKDQEQVLPIHLAKGQLQDVADIQAKKKKTKPPKRFTEGTLLTAMQTAGQSLDEKELSEAMKETWPRDARHTGGHDRSALETRIHRPRGEEFGGDGNSARACR